MRILGIDPGTTESAFVLYDGERIHSCGIHENNLLLRAIITAQRKSRADILVCEMVASYGMPVGASIFETVYWIGRFCQAFGVHDRVFRGDIKNYFCGSARAKDSNVTQALIDRYAPGAPNKGKGSKKEPGLFYGFKRDIWQAFAVAAYYYDKEARK